MATAPPSDGSEARHRLVQRFAVDRTTPGAARSALARLDLPPELADDVMLVLSELVSNGVMHSKSAEDLQVLVDVRPGTLRLEVRDGGQGFAPAVPRPPTDGAGGRGLVAVHRIADRWGVERNAGTRVWVEVWHGPSLSRHAEAPVPRAALAVALEQARLRRRREQLAARRPPRLEAGCLVTEHRRHELERLLAETRLRSRR